MRSPFSSAARTLLALGFALGLGGLVDGCSLKNVSHDSCSSDTQCATAFGGGSKCQEGYCTDPVMCTTGHDCRKQAGGGACVNGMCTLDFPTNPNCDAITEPPDVLKQKATGSNAPLLIGGIFSLAGAHDLALTKAARLAVQEINANGGLNNGQQVGIVFCDNGGSNDMATKDQRLSLDDGAIDYLAGTLGVPYIVGPLTSADSVELINELKRKSLPTVVISPSATSPDLTEADDRLHKNDPYGLFWRTCPSDLLQGQIIAKNLVAPDSTITHLSVIYIDDSYGGGLASVVSSTYGSTKTKLFPYKDPDTIGDPTALDAFVTQVLQDPSQAVLMISVKGAASVTLLKAMVAKDSTVKNRQFFFTDGSEDADLLAAAGGTDDVATILKAARGTAPAPPDASNVAFQVFATNLQSAFKLDATSASFLAQTYDATYVGAYGVVYASKNGSNYDGLDVAAGMAHLSSGTAVTVGPNSWNTARGALNNKGTIDITGISGPLNFDASTGEAPGAVQEWSIDTSGASPSYSQVQIFLPQ